MIRLICLAALALAALPSSIGIPEIVGRINMGGDTGGGGFDDPTVVCDSGRLETYLAAEDASTGTWVDSSSNGRDYTATGTLDLVTGAKTGESAVNYSTTGEYHTYASGVAVSQPVSYLAVVNIDCCGGTRWAFRAISTTGSLEVNASEKAIVSGSGSAVGATAFNLDEWVVISGRSASGTGASKVWLNGVEDATGTLFQGILAAAEWRVGEKEQAGNEWWLQTFVMCSGLSEAEHEELNDWACDEFDGVTGCLLLWLPFGLGRRRRFVAVATLAVAALGTPLAAQPTSDSLVPSDLVYVGAYQFNAPNDDGCRNAYSLGLIAIEDDVSPPKIWISGAVNTCLDPGPYWSQCTLPGVEPSTPVSSSPTMTCGSWQNVDGALDAGIRDEPQMMGMVRTDSGWLWTAHAFYNADESQDLTHGFNGTGEWTTESHTQLTGGYIIKIPTSPQNWQTALGAEYASGLGWHSIRQQGSYGPAFVALDGLTNPATHTGVINDTILEQVTLASISDPGPGGGELDGSQRLREAAVMGAAWVHGTGYDSVIYAGYECTTDNADPWAAVWYGTNEHPNFPGVIDECGTAYGRHCDAKTAAMWIYDPDDLYAVKQGTSTILDIAETHRIDAPELVDSACGTLGGVAWDPVAERLYVGAREQTPGGTGEPRTIVHVYDVDTGASPPPSGGGTKRFSIQKGG